MEQFSQEEIKNILALVSLAPIKGQDAMTVAMLQQKLSKMLKPEPDAKKETKPDKGE